MASLNLHHMLSSILRRPLIVDSRYFSHKSLIYQWSFSSNLDFMQFCYIFLINRWRWNGKMNFAQTIFLQNARYWCVLFLIEQAKIFSPRFPILLLHSSQLSWRKPHLVWMRGPPCCLRWPSKNSRFFENCWRYPSLKDYISRSTWPIRARVCLLESSDSLHLRKNMKIGIYRFLPILGQHQCLVDNNPRGTSRPVTCI